MTRESASAYRSTQYTGMSPERLILALLDAALTAITRAEIAIEDGHVAKRGESVSRALAIIDELQGCLDLEAGEIASNLFALYDYAQRELLSGNLRCEMKHMQNAEAVISEIREGWAAMLEQRSGSLDAAEPHRTAEYA